MSGRGRSGISVGGGRIGAPLMGVIIPLGVA
jgi:hypothetical protein